MCKRRVASLSSLRRLWATLAECDFFSAVANSRALTSVGSRPFMNLISPNILLYTRWLQFGSQMNSHDIQSGNSNQMGCRNVIPWGSLRTWHMYQGQPGRGFVRGDLLDTKSMSMRTRSQNSQSFHGRRLANHR